MEISLCVKKCFFVPIAKLNCQVMYHNDEEEDFHKCFMRSIPASKSIASNCRFIFYDFESMVMILGDHVPNLVVIQSICENCSIVTRVKPNSKCKIYGNRCKKCDDWNKEHTAFKYDPCTGCGNREVIFHGQNTVREFCAWLFSKQHANVTVTAHNARAYDAYFIYNYLLMQSITPEIIFRGSKIMYCKVGRGLNIKILDSLNFLNMPLDNLPKSFSLKEMKKGHFPHLYNMQEMNNLKGSKFLPHLLPLQYYDVDNMNIEKREKFLMWYENNKHKCFDFYEELLKYCRSDVDILLNACWKFRKLYMESTGPDSPIDPFDYITITSLCMGTFREKFLSEKWKILTKSKAREGCSHNNWECLCKWNKGCKLYGDAPVEMLHSDGTWAVLIDVFDLSIR